MRALRNRLAMPLSDQMNLFINIYIDHGQRDNDMIEKKIFLAFNGVTKFKLSDFVQCSMRE